MTLQLKELLLDDGMSPFGEWFKELEGVAAAKVQVALARMEQGNLSSVEWFRGIGEFRIDWGPGRRSLERLQASQGSKRMNTMALTRNFKDTVAARVRDDPAFAKALLDEAITLFLDGEPDTAKLILRDLVNATVGFEDLAEAIHKPAKSLHRMLSVSGNPTMTNISSIFAAIKRKLGVEVRTKVVAA